MIFPLLNKIIQDFKGVNTVQANSRMRSWNPAKTKVDKYSYLNRSKSSNDKINLLENLNITLRERLKGAITPTQILEKVGLLCFLIILGILDFIIIGKIYTIF